MTTPVDSRIVKGAATLGTRIRQMKALLVPAAMIPAIGQIIMQSTLRRFDDEVDPDGNAWPAHAEATLERRFRKPVARGDKLLVNQGDLRRAIAIVRGGAGSAFSNTGAGLRIGIAANAVNAAGKSIAVYARANNRGTRHAPARRFLGISVADVTDVDAFLQRRGDAALSQSF